jgi:hypothetical protein
MIGEFVSYLRGNAEPSCPPIAARMSVAAGCQATESIRKGGIALDIPAVARP